MQWLTGGFFTILFLTVLDIFPIVLDTFPIILYIFSVVADSILPYPNAIFYSTKKPEPLPAPVFLVF